MVFRVEGRPPRERLGRASGNKKSAKSSASISTAVVKDRYGEPERGGVNGSR
jgi:hypothetical protein